MRNSIKGWLKCAESPKWRQPSVGCVCEGVNLHVARWHSATATTFQVVWQWWRRDVAPRCPTKWIPRDLYTRRTSGSTAASDCISQTHTHARDWCLSNNPLRHQMPSALSDLWHWAASQRLQRRAPRSLTLKPHQYVSVMLSYFWLC